MIRPIRQGGKAGTVAALDVGAGKVCCMVARLAADGAPRIVGAGQHASAGLKGGRIVDMDAAEQAIRGAVHMAEEMAGDTIRQVIVSLVAGRPASGMARVEIPLAGQAAGAGDIRRLLGHMAGDRNRGPGGKQGPVPDGHEIVHRLPLDYSIDDLGGVRDPRGMVGRRLGARLHLVTAPGGPLRILRDTVARCHLEPRSFAFAGYAAGLSCLGPDERELGVALVDLGAGSTDIAIFYEDEMIFADSVPVGGRHVTSDIARGFSTTLTAAERLKTLHGTASATGLGDREVVDAPGLGDGTEAGPAVRVEKSRLAAIVRARMVETLELVGKPLQHGRLSARAGNRLVLTGGASQLDGLPELVGAILGKQARIGRPGPLAGLPAAMHGPAFAACAGLIGFAMAHPEAAATPQPAPWQEESGRFTERLGQWLREHF